MRISAISAGIPSRNRAPIVGRDGEHIGHGKTVVVADDTAFVRDRAARRSSTPGTRRSPSRARPSCWRASADLGTIDLIVSIAAPPRQGRARPSIRNWTTALPFWCSAARSGAPRNPRAGGAGRGRLRQRVRAVQYILPSLAPHLFLTISTAEAVQASCWAFLFNTVRQHDRGGADAAPHAAASPSARPARQRPQDSRALPDARVQARHRRRRARGLSDRRVGMGIQFEKSIGQPGDHRQLRGRPFLFEPKGVGRISFSHLVIWSSGQSERPNDQMTR